MMLREINNPLVYAIVVGTNEKPWLGRCLKTLSSSSYSALRVIYVDNASHDGSPEFVENEIPQITVVRNSSNLGFAAANNIGISIAIKEGAKYIFLVNPDTHSPETLVSDLVSFMEENPAYGIVGPLQLEYESNGSEYTLNEWSKIAIKNGERHAFYHWDKKRATESGPLQGRAEGTLEHAYVQGAAMFIRSDVLNSIGLFDETYHTYYEEVDLCRRTRWIGYRVALLLNLFIHHKGGGGTIGSRSKYRNYHYSRNKYYYLFTDPTYKLRECVKLAFRWLKFDLKDSIYHRHGDITNWVQFLSILWWLISHVSLIRSERKRRVSIILGYQNITNLL
jgi:GT2 family glycosyltransferase